MQLEEWIELNYEPSETENVDYTKDFVFILDSGNYIVPMEDVLLYMDSIPLEEYTIQLDKFDFIFVEENN